MALTCDRCLQGDSWRCRGRGCANYDSSRPVRKVRSSSRHQTSTNRRRNNIPASKPVLPPWEDGVPAPMLAAIRQAQEEGLSNYNIMRRFAGAQAPGMPIEQVFAGKGEDGTRTKSVD